MGLGCWAIGGETIQKGKPVGWGKVDDQESIRAIHRAIEMGVNFFDTADTYGAGHSEKVLAVALAGRRDRVVIASKFGYAFNEATRDQFGPHEDITPEYVTASCEASLRRLKTDYLDLYQFHLGRHERMAEIRDTLEGLVKTGKIRWYGWSTDSPESARFFAAGAHCAAIQQNFSVFGGNRETLAICEENDLASIIRGPLAKGLLTGKFTHQTAFPAEDVRYTWNFREDGDAGRKIDLLDQLRPILTGGGRSLTQGALAYLWAISPQTIPIPGFKTVAQVEENCGALAFGPLTRDEAAKIDRLVATLNG